ncbi:MAG: hypothetical protein CL933_24750 [Deltaproteobacteria bacterium]|nr:hypothetical protein [Deltaproteobacteria bacterium]
MSPRGVVQTSKDDRGERFRRGGSRADPDDWRIRSDRIGETLIAAGMKFPEDPPSAIGRPERASGFHEVTGLRSLTTGQGARYKEICSIE